MRALTTQKETVNIAIINQQHRIPVDSLVIKKIAQIILSREKLKNKDLSITIVSEKKIRKLNKEFLGKDRTTDVLSFSFSSRESRPASENTLGDVVVSSGAAIKNARVYKTTAKKELYLYVIHGILHLAGYDDGISRERAVMRKKEQFYLKKIIF